MPRKRRLESHQRAHIHVISESVGAHIQIIRSRVSCEFTMRLVVKRLPAASAWHVGRATLSTKHLYSQTTSLGIWKRMGPSWSCDGSAHSWRPCSHWPCAHHMWATWEETHQWFNHMNGTDNGKSNAHIFFCDWQVHLGDTSFLSILAHITSKDMPFFIHNVT